MSRLNTAIQTSHTLSLAAMEEASRTGERTADLEHLLLALVLSEQDAGGVLRSLGLTLEATRQAIEAQHAEQLAALGIESAPQTGQRIVFHETGGYEWSERASALLSSASGRGKRGDASAVLRELLAEPSGLIAAVLGRLDTTPQAITARLDELDALTTDSPPATIATGRLSRTATAFVPAEPAAVWELLSEPPSVPAWDQSVGSVASPASAPDGAPEPTEQDPSPFSGRARTVRDDGRAIRVTPDLVAMRITRTRCEPRELVEWRFEYPDSPGANAKLVRFVLEPAAGGTQLRTSLAWERQATAPRRTLRGYLLRPLVRVAMWFQVSQLNAAVSRAFR